MCRPFWALPSLVGGMVRLSCSTAPPPTPRRVPLPSNEGCGPALDRLPPPWPATTTAPEDDDGQRGSQPAATLWPARTSAASDSTMSAGDHQRGQRPRTAASKHDGRPASTNGGHRVRRTANEASTALTIENDNGPSKDDGC
ncbi:hypothetical protein BJ912DRAFT_925739 [Pholiota molesta]|nr:hypothetical protein BJ912DRAFT_925739 [Pholiota molesta]